jgi:hypothetical protein
MSLQPFVGPCPLFNFLILYTVGRTPWMGDQSVARPLSTHRTTQRQNKRSQSPMPWLGFEPTILVFEGAKTVHALDGAPTVSGHSAALGSKNSLINKFPTFYGFINFYYRVQKSPQLTTDWMVSGATLISIEHETENIKYKFTVEKSPVFRDIRNAVYSV